VSAANASAADPEAPVRRAYEAALAKQRAGDSAGAVADFRSFLKLYPRHELAPNAQYWLGEAYFRMADYPNAIAAQQKLLVTHPDHLKAPDAMLILANAQSANGDQSGARRTLEDLIAKHPLSEAAEKAKQRLARLK
jgi:tol-pal system protein YbgF